MGAAKDRRRDAARGVGSIAGRGQGGEAPRAANPQAAPSTAAESRAGRGSQAVAAAAAAATEAAVGRDGEGRGERSRAETAAALQSGWGGGAAPGAPPGARPESVRAGPRRTPEPWAASARGLWVGTAAGRGSGASLPGGSPPAPSPIPILAPGDLPPGSPGPASRLYFPSIRCGPSILLPSRLQGFHPSRLVAFSPSPSRRRGPSPIASPPASFFAPSLFLTPGRPIPPSPDHPRLLRRDQNLPGAPLSGAAPLLKTSSPASALTFFCAPPPTLTLHLPLHMACVFCPQPFPSW